MSHATLETRLQGVPLSPGTAIGRACFYRQAISQRDDVVENVTAEENRLLEALEWMLRRLETLAEEAEVKLDTETADIFRAHRMILASSALQERLFEAIRNEHLSAESAVEDQLRRYQNQLQAMDIPYLRERVADIADMQRELLNRLRGVTPSLRCKDQAYCQIGQCRLGNDHILVASELTPSLTIEMDDRTKGFIVEKGGRHSHAAILANALGLPAVSGIKELAQTIPLDARLFIDGTTGEVVLNPSDETLARHRDTARTDVRSLPVIEPVPGYQVMANIDCSGNIHEAVDAAAEGIGLYRTEMEMLAAGRLLTETEQEMRYSEVIRAMGDKPVYIRLLDIGADKAAPWLRLPQEDNPALGCRGARLLLSHSTLLQDQARALNRVAMQRPIHVIYPMIIDRDQFLKLRALFAAAIADMPRGRLWHGVMLEVPSACLQAWQLLEEADFGCIGTNDLVQYLFAVDRGSTDIEYEDLLDNPILWSLIEELAKVAREVGKPLSLCGELAGDPRFSRRIIEAGVTTISTNPRYIAAVRQAVRI